MHVSKIGSSRISQRLFQWSVWRSHITPASHTATATRTFRNNGPANLIDEADRRRYDPDPPRPAWCREQAIGFYAQVQATRVMPRVCPVEPALILAAEKAWAAVARELDPTGRLRADQSREGVV